MHCISWRCSLGCQHEAYDLSQKRSFPGTFNLNIHLFLKIVHRKGFFGEVKKIDFFDLAPDSRYFLTTALKKF